MDPPDDEAALDDDGEFVIDVNPLLLIPGETDGKLLLLVGTFLGDESLVADGLLLLLDDDCWGELSVGFLSVAAAVVFLSAEDADEAGGLLVDVGSGFFVSLPPPLPPLLCVGVGALEKSLGLAASATA